MEKSIFNNDLRRGDHFNVLFEKYYREDEFSDYGDIVAAEFTNAGRTLQAFSFVIPGDDAPLYYDAQGAFTKATVSSFAIPFRTPGPRQGFRTVVFTRFLG